MTATWVKLDEPGWYCQQLGCTGGDIFKGRPARWTGPVAYGRRDDLRDKYCGTCKREAKKKE